MMRPDEFLYLKVNKWEFETGMVLGHSQCRLYHRV
jgi:hypothetical protein